MALEINEHGKEEKGKEQGMSQEDMNLVHQLQERLAKLEAEKASQGAVGGGLTEEFMMKFLNGLNAPKPIDEGTGQFKFNQMHTEADIDPKDVLDKKDQVTFFSHRTMYPIVDDKRGGRNIRAPYNVILFKYFTQKRVPNGKETDVINISLYTCKSKVELEWLRKHSMYNVLFFENMNSALSTNADRSARLAKQIISMQNMGQHDVAQTAMAHGIAQSTDIQAMKIKIAEKIVDDQMAREKSHFERVVHENEAERAMLNS